MPDLSRQIERMLGKDDLSKSLRPLLEQTPPSELHVIETILAELEQYRTDEIAPSVMGVLRKVITEMGNITETIASQHRQYEQNIADLYARIEALELAVGTTEERAITHSRMPSPSFDDLKTRLGNR